MLDDAKAIEILKEIAADEWDRPLLDSQAAKWALDKIAFLEKWIGDLQLWVKNLQDLNGAICEHQGQRVMNTAKQPSAN